MKPVLAVTLYVEFPVQLPQHTEAESVRLLVEHLEQKGWTINGSKYEFDHYEDV